MIFEKYGKPVSVRKLGVRLHPIAGFIVLAALLLLIVLADITARGDNVYLPFLCVYLAGAVTGVMVMGTSRAWCKDPKG